MSTQAERRQLRAALEQSLGAAPATTLMELFHAVGWGDVARKTDLDAHGAALRGEMAELRGEMAELRGEMAELRSELRGDMTELRSELRGDMTELRSELRGDITKLSARIDGLVARQLLANVPLAFGVAALVLAAARLG